MRKLICSLFGVFAYLIGSLGIIVFIFFISPWDLLPFHINSETADDNKPTAIFPQLYINLSLLVLFGLHHTLMARKSLKDSLIRHLPAELERSLYVLFSGIFTIVLCIYWQPLPGVIWAFENRIVASILTAIHLTGWLVLFAATYEIDHLHLMGVKQSFGFCTPEQKQLQERFLYRIVRHPIQTGFLLLLWPAAEMSTTQFMLAAGLTIYIAIGLHFEEKSLIAEFGSKYIDYKTRVPSVMPLWPIKTLTKIFSR